MNNLELLEHLYNNEYIDLFSLIELMESDLILDKNPELLALCIERQKMLDEYIACIEDKITNKELYQKIIDTFGQNHQEVRKIDRLQRWNDLLQKRQNMKKGEENATTNQD